MTWHDHVSEEDMEFVVGTGAIKPSAHPRHLAALLELSPFKPGHRWEPGDADWFDEYKKHRAKGGREELQPTEAAKRAHEKWEKRGD